MTFSMDQKDGSGLCRQLASNLTLGVPPVPVKGGTVKLTARLEQGVPLNVTPSP
jgi:hypothetical protein